MDIRALQAELTEGVSGIVGAEFRVETARLNPISEVEEKILESFVDPKDFNTADQWLDELLTNFDMADLVDECTDLFEGFIYTHDGIKFYRDNSNDCMEAVNELYDGLTDFAKMVDAEDIQDLEFTAGDVGARELWRTDCMDTVNGVWDLLREYAEGMAD